VYDAVIGMLAKRFVPSALIGILLTQKKEEI
jgi:hypothetical protein